MANPERKSLLSCSCFVLALEMANYDFFRDNFMVIRRFHRGKIPRKNTIDATTEEIVFRDSCQTGPLSW